MTFPTIPTGSRVLSVLQTDTSGGTVTSPNLSSLTKNAGDLLIAIVFTYDGNSTDAEFSSWGGGFTEFEDEATTSTIPIGCAYKWSTGSETGTFTVAVAGGAAGSDAAFFLISIAGAHPSAAPEAAGYATGTSAAANIGAITPSWGAADTLFIMAGAAGETATGGAFAGMSSGDPTNYSNSVLSGISADVVGGIEGKLSFRQLNAASEDPPNFSPDTSNARNAGLIIAVRPAPDVVTNESSFTANAYVKATIKHAGLETSNWTLNDLGASTMRATEFANGYWVAVGDAGALFYRNAAHPDGTWTSNTQGSTNLRDVAYGEGWWVAVGDSGNIRYTGDPTGAWSLTDVGAVGLLGVATDGATWLAVGSGGEIYYADEPDSTWTLVDLGTDQFNAVAYGNGYWVIAGTTLQYATDPAGSWTAISVDLTGIAWGVAYGNGVWVASATDGEIAYKVGDPTGSWTVATIGTSTLNGVTYANGKFVVVGSGGEKYWSPSPSLSWTDISAASTTNLSIAYANGAWLLTALSGETYYTIEGFSADANISRDGIAGSFTANAEISSNGSTVQDSITADAHISRDGVAGSFSADAHVSRDGIAQSFTADAYVAKTLASSFSVDANISRDGIAGSFTADANIARDGIEQSITADAHIARDGLSGQFTADAHIARDGNPGSFTADAHISIDGVAGSIAADAFIKRVGQAGSLTADAYVKSTIASSFTANSHVARDGMSGSVTADAHVKRAGIEQSLTANAHLARDGIGGSFTANAEIRYVGVPVWTTPGDDVEITDTTPTLNFTMPGAVGPMHFWIELDTVDTFDSGAYRVHKSQSDQTGWEYWDGGAWQPIPQSGVANTYAGNEARYTIQTPLSNTTWYRVVSAVVM